MGSVQVPLATQGQGAPLAPPRAPVCVLPSHGDSCTPGPEAFAQRANDQETGNARGLWPGVRVTSAPPTGRFQTAEAETCPGSHDHRAQTGNGCARRPQETGHAGAGPPSTCRSLPCPRGAPMSPGPPSPPCLPRGETRPAHTAAQGPGGQDPARTRPEPAPRRKPHHRPPAAAAVSTSSSQEEPPRAEHRAKGGPAPSLTTQTNMGRTAPPPRARWADGGFLLQKHTNPYALTHTPARTVPRASDDRTWLGAGRLSPPLKRRVPCRPGSPGAPGTSVPKPRQRRSLHITACAATASPPRVPRPPGSAVPLPRGSDCVAFHGEGLSRTAASTRRTRVTTRPGACAGWGGEAVPTVGLEKWMHAGCASPSRQPRVRTHACTLTHTHLHTCTLVHGHV